MSAPKTSSAEHEPADARVRCLVVGYDRSESARDAVNWAARQLSGDGKLVLVYACSPLHAPPSPLSSGQERRKLAGAVIEELLLEAEDPLLDADLCTEIYDEDPVSALTDAASRHNADAIVVGREHHSLLHKTIGTVTTELLTRSPIPVTTVPRSVDPG